MYTYRRHVAIFEKSGERTTPAEGELSQKIKKASINGCSSTAVIISFEKSSSDNAGTQPWRVINVIKAGRMDRGPIL